MTWLLIEKKIGCYQSKLATPSRDQVVETERELWQESIHFQRWVECTCMFWKRRNLVTRLHCPDIGSCLISSSTNRYVVDRFGITITRLGNECMLLYLASSERDDVLISSETIPVPLPPSAVLNNVFGTEHSSPSEATWYYPSWVQNPPAHYSDNLQLVLFYEREWGDVVSWIIIIVSVARFHC